MKNQLCILLALCALGTASPRNAVPVENVEDSVGIAERKEFDEPTSDYQSDRYYDYGSGKWSMLARSAMPYSMYPYYSRTAYNKMASDLAVCQQEKNKLLAAAGEEVQEEAGRSVEVVKRCSQKADPGICLAAFTRYYYNDETNTCEKFVYGGCLGNTNNFMTKTECEMTCDRPAPRCLEPAYSGPCSRFVQRWYHDSADNECKLFWYGGCYKNGNNFETKAECDKVC